MKTIKKYKIGIMDKTKTELQTLTPIEKHQQCFHLTPMQSPIALHHVRLENVQARIKQGWVLKAQNELQMWKVAMANLVHLALAEGTIKPRKAKDLFNQVAYATSENRHEISDNVKSSIGKP